MAQYTEDEFDAQFVPIDPPSGEQLWTMDEIIAGGIPFYRVWTYVESDGGLYYLSGIHYVNRMDPVETYMVTEHEPPERETHEVTLFEPGEDDEDEGA